MSGTGDRVLIVGVGAEDRGDDAAGIAAARLLAAAQRPIGVDVRVCCEPAGLLTAWEGFEAVVLLDAMRSDGPPGELRRFDVSSEPLPVGRDGATSSHLLSVHDAIELARVLGRLPGRVIVLAIVGADFGARSELSPLVRAGLNALAAAAVSEAEAFSRR